MYCKNCGAQNKDGAKFCTSCGTQLSNIQQDGGQYNAYPQPDSTSAKRKSSKGLIVILSLLFVVIILAVVFVILLVNGYTASSVDGVDDTQITQDADDMEMDVPVDTLAESAIYAYCADKTLYDESLRIWSNGELTANYTFTEDNTISRTKSDLENKVTQSAEIKSFLNGSVTFTFPDDTSEYCMKFNDSADGILLEISKSDGTVQTDVLGTTDPDKSLFNALSATSWTSDYIRDTLGRDCVIFNGVASPANRGCIFCSADKSVSASCSIVGSDAYIYGDGYCIFLSASADDTLNAYITEFVTDDDGNQTPTGFIQEKWNRVDTDDMDAELIASALYADTVSLANLSAFNFSEYDEETLDTEVKGVDKALDTVISPGYKSMFIKDYLSILEKRDGKYYIPPCDYDGPYADSFTIDEDSFEQNGDSIKCTIIRAEIDRYSENPETYYNQDSVTLKKIDGEWKVDNIKFGYNY